jgi:hypothetical protein
MVTLLPEEVLLCHACSPVCPSRTGYPHLTGLDGSKFPLGLSRRLLGDNDSVFRPETGFQLLADISKIDIRGEMLSSTFSKA